MKDSPLIEFDPGVLRGLRSCRVRPSRSDRAYLATKTFGVNLAVRGAFALSGIHGGASAARVVCALSWHQLQDAACTLYGRSYLNLLARAAGGLRIAGRGIGDLVFVYVQVSASEVLTRLILGPVGNTPSALTLAGLGMVFLNVGQGMIAGGSIIPAINQVRKAGFIGERACMHIYQLSGLTIHLGLLATFGYQALHAWATAALSIASWSFYAVAVAIDRGTDLPKGSRLQV
ncbi:MAG: hypothetical protein WCU88_03000 [Elusimicrobiota bacterium]|jgi:hypothetical protein